MPDASAARRSAAFLGLAGLGVALCMVSLAWSAVDIPLGEVILILLGREAAEPAWRTIVMDIRLPRTLAAMLVGAGLGVGGLTMQTVFRNPLADPFILGVSSGASLGVACVVLLAGAAENGLFVASGLAGNLGTVAAAALGAGAVLAVMLGIASRVHDTVVVLILGVMVSALVDSFVTVLIYFSDEARTRSFVSWGFGSFARVNWDEMPVFTAAILAGLGIALAAIKPLNAFLLGERYARSMGLEVNRARIVILAGASLMAGAAVAYCGPIAFLGIAIPHLARGLFGTSDHRVLVPATMLIGICVAIACGIVAELPGSSQSLPLNAATALFGAPVVLWVLLRRRRGIAV